mgnify:CR=1 FL=1|tara:strand:+ start:843 stop:1091 length:249 start_codon:yes stop_codon:yes gene_type:complete
MIIEVSLKTPDALRDAITAQVTEKIEREEVSESETDDPFVIEYLIEDEVNKILQFAERWFTFEEGVTLSLNTVSGTCTVDTA